MKKSGESLYQLHNYTIKNKQTNKKLCIIGVLEREEREKGEESLFIEIMAENFLNLGKDMYIQVNEVNRCSNSFNFHLSIPR